MASRLERWEHPRGYFLPDEYRAYSLGLIANLTHFDLFSSVERQFPISFLEKGIEEPVFYWGKLGEVGNRGGSGLRLQLNDPSHPHFREVEFWPWISKLRKVTQSGLVSGVPVAVTMAYSEKGDGHCLEVAIARGFPAIREAELRFLPFSKRTSFRLSPSLKIEKTSYKTLLLDPRHAYDQVPLNSKEKEKNQVTLKAKDRQLLLKIKNRVILRIPLRSVANESQLSSLLGRTASFR